MSEDYEQLLHEMEKRPNSRAFAQTKIMRGARANAGMP
jgi:hypothetical protein